MRKLLFALVMMMTGAFAFGAATPASAAAAGTAAGLSDVVRTESGLQQVYHHRHWRRGFCWRHPYHWRCRRGYYRPYYRRHYYPRRHYYRRHHYRW